MIDHIALKVSDLQKSADFYEKALAPFSYKKFKGDFDGAVGFGANDTEGDSGHVWLFDEGNLSTISVVHIAFVAKDEDMVWAFYDAAIRAGGRDNGAPGLRPEYGEKYFGAFVLDPDGNNIEATCYVR